MIRRRKRNIHVRRVNISCCLYVKRYLMSLTLPIILILDMSDIHVHVLGYLADIVFTLEYLLLSVVTTPMYPE